MQHEPLQVAWSFVEWLGPVIWWSKALAALAIGVVMQLLPNPVMRGVERVGLSRAEWHLVMWSRAGALIGGLLLLLSVATPINAFGPLGDLVFYPSMAVNVLCLAWLGRAGIIGHLSRHRPPELSLFRSFFIAGRPSGSD